MRLTWLIVVAGLAVAPSEQHLSSRPELGPERSGSFSQGPLQPEEPELRVPVLPAEDPLRAPPRSQPGERVGAAGDLPTPRVLSSEIHEESVHSGAEADPVPSGSPSPGTAAGPPAVPAGAAVSTASSATNWAATVVPLPAPVPVTATLTTPAQTGVSSPPTAANRAASPAPAPAATPRLNPLAQSDPVRPSAFLDAAEPEVSTPSLAVRRSVSAADSATDTDVAQHGSGITVRAIDEDVGDADGVVNGRLEIQITGEGWVYLPTGSGLDLVNTTRNESRSRFVFLAREDGDYVLNFSNIDPASGTQRSTSVPLKIAPASPAGLGEANSSSGSASTGLSTDIGEPQVQADTTNSPVEAEAAPEPEGPAEMLALARTLENRLPEGPERARDLYQRLLREHPLALEAGQARERLRYLDRFYFRVR